MLELMKFLCCSMHIGFKPNMCSSVLGVIISLALTAAASPYPTAIPQQEPLPKKPLAKLQNVPIPELIQCTNVAENFTYPVSAHLQPACLSVNDIKLMSSS